MIGWLRGKKRKQQRIRELDEQIERERAEVERRAKRGLKDTTRLRVLRRLREKEAECEAKRGANEKSNHKKSEE